MIRTTTALFLPLALALSMALPHDGLADSQKLKIVFSVPNMAFPWAAFVAKVAQDTGKKLDADVLPQDGQDNSSTQSSELRNAITQGVDGVVLCPIDVRALVPAVNDVIAANIPLVTIDRYVIGTSKPVAQFGADNVTGGIQQAKYVVEHFPAGAKIILITGEPGSSPAIDRAAGVHQTLKAAGDKYQIIAEQTGNFARAQGFTVTQNLLTSLGTLPDVIIASNDDMALGAVKALEQAKVPKGKVMVLGFDALPEGLAAVRGGEMAATVEQRPGEQVELSMTSLVNFIRNKKPLESKKLTPIVITKDNLNEAERYSEVK
jgi:inositol transport system substrate-binding protein